MQKIRVTIDAFWDAEAGCWVAESDDVFGLATGADTLDELWEKIGVMVPELLEANHGALQCGPTSGDDAAS